MKKTIITLALIVCSVHMYGQWKPVGEKIMTTWGENLNPDNVLPEYPRPIMEREQWQNLNGLWNYAIAPVNSAQPTDYQGKILVPFAVESALSGVAKPLSAKEVLWYKREFTLPKAWKSNNVLLHFGAVDWKAEVFVNDVKIGSHTGGFTPFYFDITPYLKDGAQTLTVKVWDPTTDGYQPVGKQNLRAEGIWYTPVSGIWQTVWLEPVAKNHIVNLRNTPDIDSQKLSFDVAVSTPQIADVVEVTVKDGKTVVASQKSAAGQLIELYIKDAKLWSPESPFLYDVEVSLLSNGRVIDRVNSYAAMRKLSTSRDKNGIMRMQLNNKDYVHFGPLDQGWWPDGLYTAPTDEALKYDIELTKEFGYNMIRKHVKVEPARWYTHCDKMGMLVWQDMPNGDRSPHWQMHEYFSGTEAYRSAESETNFRKEWKEIMDYLYSYPSIAVWVPFNEAWGQFKTADIVEFTKSYDPSRLVNPASGGNHYRVGDMLDMHHYPNPTIKLIDPQRVNVLGEYGGIGMPVEGHLWQKDRNWGYVQYKSSGEVTDKYIEYAEELAKLMKSAYSGAVYTQTTDVEGEVNGLITYDRKVIKLEQERTKKANLKVINAINE